MVFLFIQKVYQFYSIPSQGIIWFPWCGIGPQFLFLFFLPFDQVHDVFSPLLLPWWGAFFTIFSNQQSCSPLLPCSGSTGGWVEVVTSTAEGISSSCLSSSVVSIGILKYFWEIEMDNPVFKTLSNSHDFFYKTKLLYRLLCLSVHTWSSGTDICIYIYIHI